MADLQEYKCPHCGGAIAFDSASQQMKCPFCESSIDVESLSQTDGVSENDPQGGWDIQSQDQWREGEQEGISVYSCQSCGGEIIGDDNTAATSCPYCGNHVVVKGQFSGNLRPDYVIPFQLDKKAAVEALKKHLRGKRFLPGVFKDENHIEEMKSIYVPFWLYDADVDAHFQYEAKKTSHSSDASYNYTTVRHYRVIRDGSLHFRRVPVDASSKIPDDLMDSIEPYDYSGLVDFQSAFLAGFLADKYDVTVEQSKGRADARIRKSTEKSFTGSADGYDSLKVEQSAMQSSNGKVKYALLPVWILTTAWKDDRFLFAMNGQTGKFVGNLPISKAAVLRWFGLLTVIFAAVIFGLQWLMIPLLP